MSNKELFVLSHKSDEWYTPAEYVEAARKVLGQIDLDPASSEVANKVVKAKKFFTKEDDGLAHEWYGKVWLNPPYGKETPKFVKKLVHEYESGKVEEAILLVSAGTTSNKWFAMLWPYVLCFTDHRIQFYTVDGSVCGRNTRGSVFVYLGKNNNKFAAEFSQFGAIVKCCNYCSKFYDAKA